MKKIAFYLVFIALGFISNGFCENVYTGSFNHDPQTFWNLHIAQNGNYVFAAWHKQNKNGFGFSYVTSDKNKILLSNSNITFNIEIYNSEVTGYFSYYGQTSYLTGNKCDLSNIASYSGTYTGSFKGNEDAGNCTFEALNTSNDDLGLIKGSFYSKSENVKYTDLKGVINDKGGAICFSDSCGNVSSGSVRSSYIDGSWYNVFTEAKGTFEANKPQPQSNSSSGGGGGGGGCFISSLLN